ncbi:4'-phosphopantetheinyl transferase family protein [Vibrio apostichopi]|uniref:4'-phosphopantetheinyl transferase family protein n=1 Tax=Vibrio apostichopi TaxID=3035453 RepID=UPI002573D870|nr:4'-phosphopantetheinyl transferase superfamily protein [Vibrio sp. FE10]
MMNNTFRPLPTDHPFIVAEFGFQKELSCKTKGIEIHVAQFDQQSYDDRLFDITNVYCPIAITQSVDKRKAEYFAGRYLVARELQNLGFSHQALEPNSDRSPRLPSDVIGSISHSNDLATVAVLPSSTANRENIGLDIQHLISSEVCDDIENIVATVQEVGLVVRYGLTRAEAVTLLFSAKESIYKALARFARRGLNFNSARLFAIDNDTVQFELSKDITSQISDSESHDSKGNKSESIICQYDYLAQQNAYLTVCDYSADT